MWFVAFAPKTGQTAKFVRSACFFSLTARKLLDEAPIARTRTKPTNPQERIMSAASTAKAPTVLQKTELPPEA